MILPLKKGPPIVSVQRIWDHAQHNALTDLIYFNSGWYCVFRESNLHVQGSNGVIRVIFSNDLARWRSIALLEEEKIDLRDPKLSITPNGELMLLMGGSIYTKRGRFVSFQSRVSFSKDGINWSPIKTILEPQEWLWRVTWFDGVGYGVSYRLSNPKRRKSEWILKLFASDNGIDYRLITPLNVKGNPNETTLRFQKDGTMIALLRREKALDDNAWIGESLPPYKEWKWHPTRLFFGGPNFIILDNGDMWAAGRIVLKSPYGSFNKTVLSKLISNDIIPLLCLPSGGDTSYPGMVYQNDQLWISYYSSHEKKTAIYLACIQL